MNKDSEALQRLKAREQVLEEYEKKLGLPPIKITDEDREEISKYFALSKTDLETLDNESLKIITVRLSQYAIFLRRILNKNKSILFWAQTELNKIIAEHISSYDKYLKHAVKEALIAKENPAARDYSSIIMEAQQRIFRLDNLINDIQSLRYAIILHITKEPYEGR